MGILLSIYGRKERSMISRLQKKSSKDVMRNIKACIMAGGKGTRLHPLTQDMPKPLALLLGRPVLFYILDLLEKHQIKDAVLTLGYQGQQLKREVIENVEQDIDVDFSFEEKPLGTAGGVKKAMSGYDGDILVISGDAMCDFDLTEAINFHYQNQSMVTILTSCVSDPREYGLVHCDESGKVKGFIEKPSYHSCSTDMASTGIYILSSQVLNYIEENKNVDFAKDIFQKLLQEEKPIYAYNGNGYWCDIGDVKSYMQCQKDMLTGKVDCKLSLTKEKEIERQFECEIDFPVYIGKGVTIGKGSKISSGSILCENVTIGENCEIEESVLLNGASVGENSSLLHAICGNGAWLGKDVVLYEEAIVGSDTILEDGVVVESGVHIWKNKKVPKDTIVREDLKAGIMNQIRIEDEGITGCCGGEITPEFCTKLGKAIGSLAEGAVVMTGCDETKSGQALYHALIAGISSSGASAWCLGKCVESQFRFCVSKSMAEYGVYLEGGAIISIHIMEQGGMPARRKTERCLENLLNHSDCKSVGASGFGSIVPMNSLKALYEIELLKLSEVSLDEAAVTVKCSNTELKTVLEKGLKKLGCELGGDLEIHLSHDGNKVYWVKGKEALIFEQLQVIGAIEEFQKGETVAVSQTTTRLMDTIAQKYGQTVYRYCDCSCNDSDKFARKLAIQKPFLRDGIMLSVKILAYMKQHALDFSMLKEIIPEFSVSSRMVAVSVPPTIVMKHLKADKKVLSEGAWVYKNGKQALLRPIKSGKGIMVFSEGEKAETAIEICDFFEHLIKDITLDS